MIRSLAQTASSAIFAIQASRLASWVGRQGASDNTLTASAAALATRYGLTFALYTHFAAGQTRRLIVTARVLNLLFRADVMAGNNLVCAAYFRGLLRGNLLERAMLDIASREPAQDDGLNRLFGVIALRAERQDLAQLYLAHAIALRPESTIEHRLLGRSLAAEGKLDEARECFRRSVALAPNTVMAHQNYAGRYDVAAYRPKPWELDEAGDLLIYDTLGQHGEDLYLRGRFAESLGFYDRMLSYQATLAQDRKLAAELQDRLAAACPLFRRNLPTRLLPYEWVTQFGHIGLIDAHLRRVALGHLPPANDVVLAPASKVANARLMACFDDKMCVVRDLDLVDDLFPYQRLFGVGFIAARNSDGRTEPFARAAARTYVEWGEQARSPLLALGQADLDAGRDALSQLGLPPGAWYVGLHVRDSGFHREARGDMSEHRNSPLADYFGAIEEITSRGGWVVRLGDKTMQPIAAMPQVIDYALSPAKSQSMDLFVLATSRFIIGTTSGLTTAAQAFGTELLLVNCVSSDWQLWPDNVDFVLRRVWSMRDNRYLSIGETYRQPLQGMLVNNIVLQERGYQVHATPADEICAATRYKLDVLDGKVERLSAGDELFRRYRAEIAHDLYLFGAGRPAAPYLENEAGAGRLGGEAAMISGVHHASV